MKALRLRIKDENVLGRGRSLLICARRVEMYTQENDETDHEGFDE